MKQHSDTAATPYRGTAADLYMRIRASAAPKLSALLRDTLDAVDDALFDLAEKADSNAEQARYFDGMREVRRRRGDIEHRFQERFVRDLVDFSEGRPRRNADARKKPEQEPGLSLVDNEDLEQSLAVTAVVSRAEGRLARPLFALHRRLAALGGAPVDDETNPLAPASLASAFRHAIEDIDCTLETRLVLYKLFDRVVVESLETLYESINAILVQAGVLPTIPSSRLPPAPSAPAQGGAAGTAREENAAGQDSAPGTSKPTDEGGGWSAGAGPQRAGGSAYADGTRSAGVPATGIDDDGDAAQSPFADELYRSIYTLMAARRTARDLAGRHAADDVDSQSEGPVVVVEVGDLLNALTLLQAELGDAEREPGDAERVKHHLINQVGRLRGDQGRSQIKARDEHSIDLVGMVFDYILQDPNLPAPIQVLLARLQIPYIKVALLDPRFFAMRSHPARRLLDELSQAGIGWSEHSDPDRRLYERIAQVVDTVLRDFDDNLALFDRLLANFRAFVASERRRAEVAEQRAAEATRGRERLLGARRRAAREVLERVRGRDLPRVVHTILTRPWANFLVLTLLRQGEDSQAWSDALAFADDLVWATEAKEGVGDRERLRSMMAPMDRMLRHGLATVAYHDSDIQALSTELQQLLDAQIDPDAEPKAQTGDAEPELALPDEPLVQPLDSSLDDGNGSRAAGVDELPVEAAWVQRAKDLTIGTWVEFRRDQGPSERARLAWISPVSGRQLYVNHKGLKVCDRSPEQLAGELHTGNASVIESSALVDRALAEILQRLRSQPVTR